MTKPRARARLLSTNDEAPRTREAFVYLAFAPTVCILYQLALFCSSEPHVGLQHGEPKMTSRADDLRALRLQKRLTQEEVAKKFGVSQSYYSAIELGKKRGEVVAAERVVNRMRLRTDRTEGGVSKAGREK
jgi:DNA-binding XRE family transcriptional regulator